MSKVSVSVVSIVHVSATSASVSDLFLLGQMYLRSHLGHKLDHPRSANVFFLQMCFFSVSLASRTFSLRCCCLFPTLRWLFAVRTLSRWFPSIFVFSPTTRPSGLALLAVFWHDMVVDADSSQQIGDAINAKFWTVPSGMPCAIIAYCNVIDVLVSTSPWYNRNGWLGVKHQVTYLPHLHRNLVTCLCELP